MVAVLNPAHALAVLNSVRLVAIGLGLSIADYQDNTEFQLLASNVAVNYVHGRSESANILAIHAVFRDAGHRLELNGYRALVQDIAARIDR